MTKGTFTVKHAVGIHARPAGRFVKLAKSFDSEIQLRNITRDTEPVNAKSLIKVIKSAAAQNHEIELLIEGPDEEAALAALTTFFEEVPENEL
jgi:phosphotransferase system HPr (HPr) family protein